MINMNDKYVTQDGRPVRVLCTNRKGRTLPPVVALVSHPEGREELVLYHEDGTPTSGFPGHTLRKVTPWDDLPTDAPVWMKTERGEIRAHFARKTCDGRPRVWKDGKTSWTTRIDVPCESVRPAEKEDQRD